MNWNHSFGTTEYVFIVAFLGFYLLYFIRTYRIAQKLHSKSRTLFVKFFIRSLAFVLLLLSLAGPFFGEAERKLLAEGKDIYLAVDLSRSMDATDVAPSRLEKVKYEMGHLLQQLANNRVGLIAFSHNAQVQSPLTFDTEALEFMLRSLNTDIMSEHGTNLCAPLALAFEKMSGGSSLNKSKIIVVLTDGEGENDCSAGLFNNFRKFDFQLFYVGVGTRNGSSIPFDDQVLRKENGEIVISSMDEKSLQRMAQQTNGRYFQINNEKNETAALIETINQLQDKLIDSRSVDVTSNKYYYFLGFALLLLVIDILITFRTFRV